jgi:hypothetical protein
MPMPVKSMELIAQPDFVRPDFPRYKRTFDPWLEQNGWKAQGFLSEWVQPFAGIVQPHFHTVDQWQITVAGLNTMGKHVMRAVSVHYSDGYTPYGPEESGPNGATRLNLRSRWSSDVHYMPASAGVMIRKAGRGITTQINDDDFVAPSRSQRNLLGDQPDGLAIYAFALEAGQEFTAPDPRLSDGQWSIVLAGVCLIDAPPVRPFPSDSLGPPSNVYGPNSVVFGRPDEPPVSLQAGPRGARLLFLQHRRRPENFTDGAGTFGPPI